MGRCPQGAPPYPIGYRPAALVHAREVAILCRHDRADRTPHDLTHCVTRYRMKQFATASRQRIASDTHHRNCLKTRQPQTKTYSKWVIASLKERSVGQVLIVIEAEKEFHNLIFSNPLKPNDATRKGNKQ